MLIEFATGNLPWSYTMQGPDVRMQIRQIKENIQTETLCSGFPSEFDAIWTYIRSLGFEDRPDYSSMKDMIEMALLRIKSITIDYDWKLAALDAEYFGQVLAQNRQVVRDLFHEKGDLSPSEKLEAANLQAEGKQAGTNAPPLKKMFLDTIDS